MGSWQKELDRVLAQSVHNKKFINESTDYYQKVVDAAQDFIGAYTKAGPQFGKMQSTLIDLAEEAALAAGELSVLEDELEAAEKAAKKEGLKLAEDGNKTDDELKELVGAVEGAIG
jgi:hypothetical protein